MNLLIIGTGENMQCYYQRTENMKIFDKICFIDDYGRYASMCDFIRSLLLNLNVIYKGRLVNNDKGYAYEGGVSRV